MSPAAGPRKAPAKKQRRRSPHPGVVLDKPDPKQRRLYWRMRFTDPDTNKVVKEKLDPLALTSAEARRGWAIAKARSIAKRKLELESGAARATGGALSDALKTYFKAHARLRPRTTLIYRDAADKLEEWAEAQRMKSADDLNRAKLMAFRDHLVREPKRVANKGGKRGTRVASSEPRSAATVNQELRALRTVLGYVRDLDLLPKLSHDDLRRALKRLPVVTDRVEFLSAAECGQLLEAALRHDAEKYTFTREEEEEQRREAQRLGLTRKEQAARRPAGSTARFTPIAPFTFFVLTTGMRVGEALGVEWSQVDLDALDYDGAKVGEIHLKSGDTKTKKPRTVGLEVSPLLRTMLAAMKLASGGEGRVFKLSDHEADAAAARLRDTYGAPASFTWQALRRTCGTFLTNAPGIFGASSAYRSARQLGHSVAVAEKAYLGVLRGLPRDARTLEDAMQVAAAAGRIVAGVGGGSGQGSNVVQLREAAQ